MKKRTCKYVYELYKKIDEGELEDLAKRNSMSVAYIHNGSQKHKPIYKDYYVIKKTKGVIYG